jgi:hypothetical protein
MQQFSDEHGPHILPLVAKGLMLDKARPRSRHSFHRVAAGALLRHLAGVLVEHKAAHDLSLARAENGKQIEAEVRAYG